MEPTTSDSLSCLSPYLDELPFSKDCGKSARHRSTDAATDVGPSLSGRTLRLPIFHRPPGEEGTEPSACGVTARLQRSALFGGGTVLPSRQLDRRRFR